MVAKVRHDHTKAIDWEGAIGSFGEIAKVPRTDARQLHILPFRVNVTELGKEEGSHLRSERRIRSGIAKNEREANMIELFIEGVGIVNRNRGWQ